MPKVLGQEPQRPMASWRWIVGVFVVSFVVLASFSGPRIKGPSEDLHFVYLANTYNSMIAAPFSEAAEQRRQGKLPFELDRAPPHRNDWASFWEVKTKEGEEFRGNWVDRVGSGPFELLGEDKVVHLTVRELERGASVQRYFVSFPPGPAWLMMPLAAIWGYEVNDVVFTLFFGALNMALIFLLLENLAAGGLTRRSRQDNLWLTGLFGFGSVHLWSAILGQVWFTALILGITFTVAYILCAIDARRPFLAGLFLALAFSTRTPLVFSAIFFFSFVFFPGGRWIGFEKERVKWALRKLILFCIPCLVVGLGLLWMNYIRFNEWSEFGHRLLAGGRIGRIQEYGLFHWHFIDKNLAAAFALVPKFRAEYPYIQISRHGMSLFLTTPALLYLLWPRPRETGEQRFIYRLTWVVVAVLAIPHFLYQNTGYEQFGYRFSLDYMAYLTMLLALGGRPLTKVFKAMILFGFFVNAFGAVTFKRMLEFYSHRFFV